MKVIDAFAVTKLIILSTAMVSCLSAQSQENVSGEFFRCGGSDRYQRPSELKVSKIFPLRFQ